jgi:hypothetical protein
MTDNYSPGVGIPLQTLSQDGRVPETRFKDAAEVSNLISILKTANDKRCRIDAKVEGLVSGNPPYKQADLKNAGQAWRANANMREAEAFLASATGAFYDILVEAPTLAAVEIGVGTPEDQSRLSRIVTEEFDRVNKEDDMLDFMFQLSQHEMVLYGLGPVMWENEYDFHARAIPKGKFMVPDGTASNPNDWEVAAVLVDYMPHQLYAYIKNEKAATEAGWKVQAVKDTIVNAAPKTESQESGPDWAFLQQQIRNNDIAYSARSKVIQVAHVYYREFAKDGDTGKISHCIVLAASANEAQQTGFLFQKLNRYDNWQQVTVPFYYDVGDGSHHSVKGIGVKFYSALELKNRLSNTIVDVSFERSKMPVRVENQESAQSFQIVSSGPFTLYPPGTEPIPLPVGGMLDAPMAVARELLATTTSNLSQYRQNLQRDKGNPITAAEVQVRAEQQSLLGKTQLNRYYAQLDAFWEERYRRLTSPKLTAINPGGKEAAEFLRRCEERGVPAEVLRKTKSVKATRVAGHGSPYLRQMALTNILQMVGGMIGSDGRMALIEDIIGSQAGQVMVSRYMPASDKQKVATQDSWEASVEHASMRVGNPVPVVGSQNHVIHFESHMGAGVQSLQSLQQGANPDEVLGFVDQVGPHMAAHLTELAADPTRQREHKLLEEQFKEFSSVADELRKDVEATAEDRKKQAAAQAQAKAIAGGTDPETQIKAAQAASDAKLKEMETQHNLKLKEMKTRQDLALKDAKTANEIRRDRVMTAHQINMDNARVKSQQKDAEVKETKEKESRGEKGQPINITVNVPEGKKRKMAVKRDDKGRATGIEEQDGD